MPDPICLPSYVLLKPVKRFATQAVLLDTCLSLSALRVPFSFSLDELFIRFFIFFPTESIHLRHQEIDHVRLRQSPNHWLLRAPPSLLILLLLPSLILLIQIDNSF
ncbi:hypothetical protein BRARA_C03024 [Brassica rapa]|uniref:Uncharacterized protein n=1 Tax=Brassica campestris TaxID=3711 RepID=A0A397ZZR6_BRACM|nr:hypothetical protein BRARA_C03024 [Brassica rapa]